MRAYQIRISDPDLQAYLQNNPYAVGPDFPRNLAAANAIIAGLRAREGGGAPRRVLLSPEQTRLSPEELRRVQASFQLLHFDAPRQQYLIDDFAWEANLVPRTARNLLVFGCADGMELLFLRAVLPDAQITALDYRDSMTPAVKEIVRPAFLEGDFHQHLKSLPGGYDLISSNHTMEHLYTPDETLQTLFGLLAPDGVLVSTLPMDANPGGPFLQKIERALESRQIHPVDLVFLDAGHPWKTNPVDLDRTMRSVGFSEVILYQRAQHLSRIVVGGKRRLRIGRTFGLALNRIFFSAPHAILKVLPVTKLQNQLCRVLLSVERRLWFGSANLKNRCAEETLVYAMKESGMNP